MAIEARQTPTGLKRLTESDSDGHFAIPNLPASIYLIKLERAGFRTSVNRGIELTVGDAVTVDFVMDVGALEQAITVDAQAGLVQVSNSDLSFLVSEKSIAQLPLNGRNYTDLALLQPGVVPFPNRDGGSVVAHGLAMSFNGQDPRSNVYLLDGTPQNDFTNGPAGSAASTALGMEAVREFRVELNAYSAEFGRNTGGQINALTKSGCNDVHGSLFEYLRNDNFDARNFFDPAEQSRVPAQSVRRLASAVPSWSRRTFFFAAYEALRERLGKTITTVIPDANARLGILPSGAVPINPAVAALPRRVPAAQRSQPRRRLGRYTFHFNQTLREDFGQCASITTSTIATRRSRATQSTTRTSTCPPTIPQFPRAFVSRNQFATLEHRFIGSRPHAHTFRASFSRTRVGQDVEANTSRPLTPFIPGAALVGDIDIGGVPRFGPQSSVNVKLAQNVYGVEYGRRPPSGPPPHQSGRAH